MRSPPPPTATQPQGERRRRLASFSIHWVAEHCHGVRICRRIPLTFLTHRHPTAHANPAARRLGVRSTNDVDTLLRFAKWSAASVVFVFGFFGFAVAWIRGMADDAEDEDGPEQNYDIHEVLGQGAFGKVVRATVKHEIRDMDVQTAKEKSRAGQ